ncbi:uncharacterized protein zgc:174906 [Cololabis saira]|uniref:uncharacterized protein zgc:174906 n=1 Tax=Cololabis saira TaxID=129043 RepID=UPI002AD390F5|nr:uncharacterized protein zgc:174906 [Cololabis saira]
MVEDPEVQLLRRQKAKLIEILSADADFVLQHADARRLLSPPGYERIKSCRVPSEKVTELLDHVIQRGPKEAKGLFDLLKEHDMQEAFPRLSYAKDLQVQPPTSGEHEKSEKRKSSSEKEDDIPPMKSCRRGCGLVKEKQLMFVARNIGKSWREIGILALNISSVKLDQIEVDHSVHVDRVFAMLRFWRNCQRGKATAPHLHSLLSQDDWALPPESIDCLLETD